jgi:2-amino-4-hydroxy-6-hydroxymethyldihydropteridine diphosphokinase
MADVYISVGSNIEAERHIRHAITQLQQHFGLLQCSSVYKSKAVGFDGDDFLNLVVRLQTDEHIEQVAALLRQVEQDNGRERNGPKFSSRTLDLDLLLYDDQVIDKKNIHVPRAEITTNAFVLLPLAELVPQLQHPVLKKSMQRLWDEFDHSMQPITRYAMRLLGD